MLLCLSLSPQSKAQPTLHSSCGCECCAVWSVLELVLVLVLDFVFLILFYYFEVWQFNRWLAKATAEQTVTIFFFFLMNKQWWMIMLDTDGLPFLNGIWWISLRPTDLPQKGIFSYWYGFRNGTKNNLCNHSLLIVSATYSQTFFFFWNKVLSNLVHHTIRSNIISKISYAQGRN